MKFDQLPKQTVPFWINNPEETKAAFQKSVLALSGNILNMFKNLKSYKVAGKDDF